MLPTDLSLLKRYTGTANLLVCPAAADQTKPSYQLVLNRKLLRVERPSETVLLREIEPHQDGKRHVVYADGHSAVVGEEPGNNR
mgnify:CR=1 FL=1